MPYIPLPPPSHLDTIKPTQRCQFTFLPHPHLRPRPHPTLRHQFPLQCQVLPEPLLCDPRRRPPAYLFSRLMPVRSRR